MQPTHSENRRQDDDLQDYPVSRAFFPEHRWFRATPRRPQCCPHFVASPFVRDQELDALRQELAGWKGTAAYWQGRYARIELENQGLHRLLDARQNRNAEPTAFAGVVEGHAGAEAK